MWRTHGCGTGVSSTSDGAASKPDFMMRSMPCAPSVGSGWLTSNAPAVGPIAKPRSSAVAVGRAVVTVDAEVAAATGARGRLVELEVARAEAADRRGVHRHVDLQALGRIVVALEAVADARQDRGVDGERREHRTAAEAA